MDIPKLTFILLMAVSSKPPSLYCSSSPALLLFLSKWLELLDYRLVGEPHRGSSVQVQITSVSPYPAVVRAR